MQRIFLVEDDGAIVRTLTEFLQAESFDVQSAGSVREAISALDRQDGFDLVLLDISLPDGDGFSVCRRAKEKNLPVIFLTASEDENSVVKGYDMDADDYIAKPFRPRELIARIHAVLRRRGAEAGVANVGELRIDTLKGDVRRGNITLSLSALEYKLLITFVNNRGLLLSRNRLLEEIWDIGGDFVNDNTLTVYIKRLREKIEPDPQNPVYIKTIRGLGYRMD